MTSKTFYTSDYFTNDPEANFSALQVMIGSSDEVTIIDDYQNSAPIHFSSDLVINHKKFTYKQYSNTKASRIITHEPYGVTSACFRIITNSQADITFDGLAVDRAQSDPVGGPFVNFIKISNSSGFGLYEGRLTVDKCYINWANGRAIQTSTQDAKNTEITISRSYLEGVANLSLFGGHKTKINIINNELMQKNDDDGHNHNVYIHPYQKCEIKGNMFRFQGLAARYALAFNGSNPSTRPANYINIEDNIFDYSVHEAILSPMYSSCVIKGNTFFNSGVHITAQGRDIDIDGNTFVGGERILKTDAVVLVNPPLNFRGTFKNNKSINVRFFGHVFGGDWTMSNNQHFVTETIPYQQWMLIGDAAHVHIENDLVDSAWVGVGGKLFVTAGNGSAHIERSVFICKADGAPFVGGITTDRNCYRGKNSEVGQINWP